MSIWIRILMAANIFLYRLTGGALGGKMAGQSVLLLHTIGRKSGKAFITPTNFYRDGANYVLVASNWGQEHNPAWYFNLMHNPETIIQVRGDRIRVRASVAEGEVYNRLWTYVTGQNAYYTRYQSQTMRKIPLVILMPISKQ